MEYCCHIHVVPKDKKTQSWNNENLIIDLSQSPSPQPPPKKLKNWRGKKTYHTALCPGALGEESALRLPEWLGETAWFVQVVRESKELLAEVVSLFLCCPSTMPANEPISAWTMSSTW